MYLEWDRGRPLADRQMIAHLYEVSERTVRRRCTPVEHKPRRGRSDGRHGGGGMALYDAQACADDLTPRRGEPAVSSAGQRAA